MVGLFAGIGGLELGLSRAGFATELFCEIDPAAQRVLAARFPDVPIHDDVRTLADVSEDAEVLTAGFPCQDLSQAGRTIGLRGSRSGLISEVFRILGGRRIPLVILENVSFMLQLAGGAALARIVDEFERLGYRWAYRVVNTLAFGLPQRRERVFLVASLDRDPAEILLADDAQLVPRKTAIGKIAHGFYWTEGIRGLGWAVDAIPTLKNGSTVGIPSPPAVLLPDGSLVKPDLRDAERLQGFPIDWTAPAEAAKRRGFRWSLIGNAVSVPVAEWLGARLVSPGVYDTARDKEISEERRWPKAARYDGNRRFAVTISTAPRADTCPHLHDFLQYSGTPLSRRATAGFLARTRISSLRFPEGFLDAVSSHLARMELEEARNNQFRRQAAEDTSVFEAAE